MKNGIYFLIFILFFAVSCGGSKKTAKIPKNARLIKGRLVNYKTGKGVEGEVLAIPPEDRVGRIIAHPTNKSGRFRFYIPEGKWTLRFNVPNCKSVKLVLDKDKKFKERKIAFKPEEKPKKNVDIIFSDFVIKFAFKSFVIELKYYKKLKELIEIMHKNSSIIIEIRGHTDKGPEQNEKLNIKFGMLRAKSVRNFFIHQGKIKHKRLKIRSMGYSVPIAPNDTEENRAKNRRVDMRIISR